MRSMVIIWLALMPLAGCASHRPAEQFGKVFYLDGTGNLGYGTQGVPRGLRDAGYTGDTEVFIWTSFLGPLADQLNAFDIISRRADELARKIEDYHRRHLGMRVNIIALSAGTGVAMKAVERLRGSKVDNLILLGSSLSHNYDASAALRNMTGKIHVYHSPRDAVLPSTMTVGTIDGKRGVQPAGLVGLKPPVGLESRIVNVRWNPDFKRLGWHGGHIDCVNHSFVRDVVAEIVTED